MNAIASEIGALGVTKILTRRQRITREFAGLLAVAGALVSITLGAAVLSLLAGADQLWPIISFRSVVTGPLVAADNPGHLQFPVTVDLPPVTWWLAAVIGLPLFVAWCWFLVRPMFSLGSGEIRHRGLATPADVRQNFGARAIRKTARWTLPRSTFWHRRLVGANGIGLHIGQAVTPKRGGEMWVDLEARVRIIARTGFGKTLRLLVPIIRNLPGPALVSSTEPTIFTATVKAREIRRPASRFPLLYSPDKRRYPVFVVECAADGDRVAGAYSSVRWNPVVGCRNFTVATRRAEALVKGVAVDDGPTSSTAGFFEDSATQVLAAWLHAAALSPNIEIADLVEWLGTSTYTVPAAILDQHRDVADPAALTNMRKHLDDKAGRTTSGVERYLTMALSSLASGEGGKVSGVRSDPQFDMEQLVRSGGTLYLIAAPDQMAVARPFLSLLASELLLAAEQVARHTPEKRLPQTFVAVLDELRYGVRVSNLPYVANTMRKFGVSYVTCSTNAGDEEALYGETAAALLKGAGVSIYGGMDEGSARDISDRAGQAPVVTASHGGLMGGSESVQHLDALTAADLQRLGAGESVVIRQGLPPVIMFTKSVYEQRGLRRRIKRETAAVAAAVTA